MGQVSLFSKLDLDYVSRSMGRTISKKELKILYTLVEPTLMIRERISPDFIKQNFFLSDNIKYEIRNINSEGRWSQTNYLLRRCSLTGYLPKSLCYVWFFSPTKSTFKNINDYEKVYNSDNRIKIEHHVASDAKRRNNGAVIVIAVLGKLSSERVVLRGQKLGLIKIPKPGNLNSNGQKVKDFISKNRDYIQGMSMEGDYGLDIRKMLTRIPETLSLDIAFPKTYKKGDGLIIYDLSKKSELKKTLNVIGYDFKQIGSIKSESSHTLSFGDFQEKIWPKGINYISTHNHENQVINDNRTPKEKKSKKNYLPLDIIKRMIKKGYPSIQKKTLNDQNHRNNIYILNNQVISKSGDSFISGIRSVANLIREMAISGSKIRELRIITNSLDKKFLDGQQAAIGALNLKNKSFTEIMDKNLSVNEHQVIGFGSKGKIDTLEANTDSDFIILIGTLKGELENSLYNKIIGAENYDIGKSKFDSILESNINKTLIESSIANVVKYAVTIGKGGLSISLIKMYLILKSCFGIEVHISSQLNKEELLFGESFASTLVLVGEKELMEFQRICNLHSVPCNTIGRLRPERNITVNKILKIKQEVLATFSTV